MDTREALIMVLADKTVCAKLLTICRLLNVCGDNGWTTDWSGQRIRYTDLIRFGIAGYSFTEIDRIINRSKKNTEHPIVG